MSSTAELKQLIDDLAKKVSLLEGKPSTEVASTSSSKDEELDERVPISPFLSQMKGKPVHIDLDDPKYWTKSKNNLSAKLVENLNRPVGIRTLLNLSRSATNDQIGDAIGKVLDDWSRPILDEIEAAGPLECYVPSTNADFEKLCTLYTTYAPGAGGSLVAYGVSGFDAGSLLNWFTGLIYRKYSTFLSDSDIKEVCEIILQQVPRPSMETDLFHIYIFTKEMTEFDAITNNSSYHWPGLHAVLAGVVKRIDLKVNEADVPRKFNEAIIRKQLKDLYSWTTQTRASRYVQKSTYLLATLRNLTLEEEPERYKLWASFYKCSSPLMEVLSKVKEYPAIETNSTGTITQKDEDGDDEEVDNATDATFGKYGSFGKDWTKIIDMLIADLGDSQKEVEKLLIEKWNS